MFSPRICQDFFWLAEPRSPCLTCLAEGRPYQALRPISPQESQVFEVILRGEHTFQGFRNCDLRAALEPGAEDDPRQRCRASGQVTRRMRLLCARGLIYKVARTNYYRLTKKGHQVMSTAIKFRQSDIALLVACITDWKKSL